MPEVSVIIPSYNHAAYIEASIQSVLNQTFQDLELIVVDDGSTDESPVILSKIKNERMKVIFQNNQGAHAAINHGLSIADGRYLAILNSDDEYYPQRIEKAIDVFHNNPEIGLVSSQIEIIDATGERLGIKRGYQNCPPWILDKPERSFRSLNNLKLALLAENYLATTSNFVFPRMIYEKVGKFTPLRYTHDWDFALRVAREADIYLINEPLLKYRIHPRNTIREDKIAMVFEICWTLAVNLPNFTKEESFWHSDSGHSSLDLLLNSLYTFRCGDILSVMLLQSLNMDRELALSLLQSDNTDRLFYMDAIQRILYEQNNEPQSTDKSKSLFSRLLSFSHSVINRISNRI